MLLEEYDLSIPMMKNLTFVFEWRQLVEPLLEGAKTWTQTRDFKVGSAAAEKGLQAKYPVILIPGIVSTVRPPALLGSELRSSNVLRLILRYTAGS